jgi:hypothetical protein
VALVSRYKKIDMRMWGDEKFRRLSRAKPNAQFLWIYLLTGPHTTALPGLWVAGPAGLAEALGWSVKDLMVALKELIELGMASIDAAARVLWLPNVVKYDRPDNPNVIKHWAKLVDDIPECDLKKLALGDLRTFVGTMGQRFANAFDASFPDLCGNAPPNSSANGSPNPSPNGSSNPFDKGMANPEPEPKPDPEPTNPPSPPTEKLPPNLDTDRFREVWKKWAKYRREKRKPLTDTTIAMQLTTLGQYGEQQAIELLNRAMTNGWIGFDFASKKGDKNERRHAKRY